MFSARRASRLRFGVAVAAAAGTLAAGLAAAAPSQPPSPRPQRILVVDFAATSSNVRLERGLGSRLAKNLAGPAATKEKQAKAADDVVNAIGNTLVKEIRALGIPAERVPLGAVPPGSGAVAIIDGRVLTIDQGNRTARTVVGFGAGASKVEADAELSYRGPDGKTRLLISYADTGKSRRTPGLAVALGAGAAMGAVATVAIVGGGLHAYSEVRGATVGADGTRLAKKLAEQLAKSFAALGWIHPAASKG
jgi:hypothetical protein